MTDTRSYPATGPAPRFYIVNQHIGWLKQYILGMSDNNWRDMRDRAESQLEQLSQEIDKEDAALSGGVAQGVLGPCTQAELDAGFDAKNALLVSMWMDRALKAEAAAKGAPDLEFLRETIRRALIDAKCTSRDTTVVNDGMTNVLNVVVAAISSVSSTGRATPNSPEQDPALTGLQSQSGINQSLSEGTPREGAPCSHATIIGLDGTWHCQKCGDAIDMAVALTSTHSQTAKD